MTGASRFGEYDYLVVGAGSAGCAAAARLARAGHRVLLLEAGGNDRRFWIRTPIGYGRTYFDPRVNWCLRTRPDPGIDGRESYWPRGKVIGGSSSINAMVYYRGLPGDFDDWAGQAGEDWDWNHVAADFDAIERVRDTDGREHGSGPLRITDPTRQYHGLRHHFLAGAAELGLTGNPLMTGGEGVGHYCITTHRGRRCSAADAFLHPTRDRHPLDVLSGVLVTRLLFEGRRAIGVEFRLRGASHRVYCRAEVIVSAGAVGSPKLLQLSGVGPGNLLRRHGIGVRADLDAVGGNLQDHLAVTYFYRSRVPTLNNLLRPWWGKALCGARYLLHRSGPLALGVNQCGGFVRSGPGLGRADVQLYFNPVSYTKIPVGKRPLLNPDPYPGFILSFQPCRPRSRGRIDIASPDPASPPCIAPGYLGESRDLETVAAGAALTAALARTEAIAGIIDEPVGPTPERMSDAERLADFRRRADTVFHPVGTCAMGRDDTASVTDSRLRVHGFDGLRVADASVFPNITSGNTNAPTIMLGWRAAGFILENAP